MIGIIPIGGSAERMNGLPKFLLPVGDSFLLAWLCGQMADVRSNAIMLGVKKNYQDLVRNSILAPINRYAWYYEADTKTMSETVLLALDEFAISNETVLFGMPDTYWTDENVYETLIDNMNDAIVNVAVWYTPPHHRSKRGMCEIHRHRILEVIDKPLATDLTWGWGAMVWEPEFWQYIKPEDPHVGFALQRALDANELIFNHTFPGKYYDCGTPDEYYECIIETQGERHETT